MDKQDCRINLKKLWYKLSTFLFTKCWTLSILSAFKTAELRDRLH